MADSFSQILTYLLHFMTPFPLVLKQDFCYSYDLQHEKVNLPYRGPPRPVIKVVERFLDINEH